jgi:hypothetical protein
VQGGRETVYNSKVQLSKRALANVSVAFKRTKEFFPMAPIAHHPDYSQRGCNLDKAGLPLFFSSEKYILVFKIVNE